MTMRTITNIKCPCGHKGSIVESENDQPYSKEWSTINLRDLDSKGLYNGKNELFTKMKPSCPKCGMTLSPDNVE